MIAGNATKVIMKETTPVNNTFSIQQGLGV
jgi:hypothetical protein